MITDQEKAGIGLVHWNKDTQGSGEFRRNDTVVVLGVTQSHADTEWYRKRIGMRGNVSAVFDDRRSCSVLLEDGYWLDFSFDELENTGEKGGQFPEIHYVPCSIWG